MKPLSTLLTRGCCILAVLAATPSLAAPTAPASYRSGDCGDFTVAVIPDTQNYVDYRHQKAAGYPFEAAKLFVEQMRYVADNARGNGGDIVFATHVGDVWQHYSRWTDPAHEQRGFKAMPNPMASQVAAGPRKETLTVEIPNAVRGFREIAGKLPFSVVPGNHDYDALWTDPTFPPQPDDEGRLKVGIRHIGGLTGYLSAFSSESEFFKGQPWYVDSHEQGADSAQIFTAGQCRFLHIGLQFDAPDASLAWAERVIRRYPGLPTIVTTHKYLDRDGNRAESTALDLSILDHRDNNPQMVWDEFISRHDQIFLVLSGHIGGQGYSVDANLNGRPVHQVMADYQDRGQVAKQAGVTEGTAIGDGWLRLLNFRLDGATPSIEVRTYSTHYRKFSSELKDYAAWYKARDGQSSLSDAAFLARDAFVIPLDDFHSRFGDR